MPETTLELFYWQVGAINLIRKHFGMECFQSKIKMERDNSSKKCSTPIEQIQHFCASIQFIQTSHFKPIICETFFSNDPEILRK